MKLFHRHSWKEIQRQFGQVGALFGSGWSDITMITYLCECGQYKQQTLNGQVKVALQRGSSD